MAGSYSSAGLPAGSGSIQAQLPGLPWPVSVLCASVRVASNTVLRTGNEPTPGSLAKVFRKAAPVSAGLRNTLITEVAFLCAEHGPGSTSFCTNAFTVLDISRNICWITRKMGPVPWHWERVCQGPALGPHYLSSPETQLSFPQVVGFLLIIIQNILIDTYMTSLWPAVPLPSPLKRKISIPEFFWTRKDL